MELVLVESPFMFRCEDKALRRIGVLRNMAYARCALHDCFSRGEAPYASHLLYTQPSVLEDDVPEERMLGIEAGLQWGAKAAKTVLYVDLGVSSGMAHGIASSGKAGRPCETRHLPGWSRALGETPRETLTRLGFYTNGQIDRIEAGLDTMFTGELQATADEAPEASGGVVFRR